MKELEQKILSEGRALNADVLLVDSFLNNQVDPRLLQLGGRILKEYQRGEDKNTALLLALKPFLRQERYAKVDQAIQLARLARVVRVALESMGQTGGEERV